MIDIPLDVTIVATPVVTLVVSLSALSALVPAGVWGPVSLLGAATLVNVVVMIDMQILSRAERHSECHSERDGEGDPR